MKKRGVNIHVHLSNRLLYTLITILVLAIIGVSVYAVAGTTPNPGHSLSQLQPCSNGEILKMAGGVWTCVDGTIAAETDTLQSVVSRGSSTTSSISVGGLTSNGLISGGGSSGNAFKIGDDAYIVDIGQANTFGIYGIQNDDIGRIKLGSTGPVLGGSSNTLTISGRVVADSGRTAIYKVTHKGCSWNDQGFAPVVTETHCATLQCGTVGKYYDCNTPNPNCNQNIYQLCPNDFIGYLV